MKLWQHHNCCVTLTTHTHSRHLVAVSHSLLTLTQDTWLLCQTHYSHSLKTLGCCVTLTTHTRHLVAVSHSLLTLTQDNWLLCHTHYSHKTLGCCVTLTTHTRHLVAVSHSLLTLTQDNWLLCHTHYSHTQDTWLLCHTHYSHTQETVSHSLLTHSRRLLAVLQTLLTLATHSHSRHLVAVSTHSQSLKTLGFGSTVELYFKSNSQFCLNSGIQNTKWHFPRTHCSTFIFTVSNISSGALYAGPVW